jgi:hypothetical protein
MMPESRKQGLTLAAAVASFLVCLATLGAVLVQVGSLKQIVMSDHERLNNTERLGSPPFLAHVAMDDVRVTAMDKRIGTVEQSIASIAAMQADIREIKTWLSLWAKRQGTDAPDHTAASKPTAGGSFPNW